VGQVARGLSIAHAHGVVHRDLKPDNLFLAGDPEVVGGERAKILDFGIATRHGDRSPPFEAGILGTPAFMSPEQCRGSGGVDQRSDVYALGCVLFTLVTGRPPFDGDDHAVVMTMHLQEPPPAASRYTPGIPAAIDRLVRRCMAKDPDRRLTASGLARTIDALLSAQAPAGARRVGRAVAAFPDVAMDTQPTLPIAPDRQGLRLLP